MSMLVQTALADLDHELASTRRMLERVPADQLEFTPHAKSWTLGKLVMHLLDFPAWGSVTLTTTELAFDAPQPALERPTDAAGFVALWDERVAAFKAQLATATDEGLQEMWQATHGGHVVLRMPRLAVIRGMIISHMIHHRAQLSIYYRLLDVPMPGLYGPSADER
jgi:uncharacterized damage-inducible protein DinB